MSGAQGASPPSSGPASVPPALFDRLAQADMILEQTIRATPETSAALSQARATLVDFVGLCVVAAKAGELTPRVSQSVTAPIRGGAGPALMDSRKIARQQGYTGNFCEDCGGCHMVRNGTCEKCNDCGSTTGCS